MGDFAKCLTLGQPDSLSVEREKRGEYLSYLAAEREMFSKVPGLEIETEISRFDVPLA